MFNFKSRIMHDNQHILATRVVEKENSIPYAYKVNKAAIQP